MSARWSGSAAAFLTLDPGSSVLVPLLQGALAGRAGRRWAVALDMSLPRVACRIDAVVATGGAVLAIVLGTGRSFAAADRRAAEDAALDLADFHAGCAGLPVLPVLLIPNGARPRQQFALPLAGAADVLEASRLTLPAIIEQAARFPPAGRDGVDWLDSCYRPLPGLLAAACRLYRGHGVLDLVRAGAGPDGVRRTGEAIADAIAHARRCDANLAVLVTGAPGAGKTLCGLDLAFGTDEAVFLTGNPTLIHVLGEALVRDAASRGLGRLAAARRVRAVLQALPSFRDHYADGAEWPAERLIVIDEAQRCWSEPHAVAKTRNRPVKLSRSEPAHLLDIAARRPGWTVLVCLLGNGQEIHDGEAGLAGWGAALAERSEWQVWAPEPKALSGDARTVLPALRGVRRLRALHLADPLRAVRAPDAGAWVDAVLGNDPARARTLATAGVPFTVTRSLDAARAAVRPAGSRTAGLLASSTARRLRAEGLGATLPHQDAGEVAHWFLDRWPDIRSGDALEVVATEFAVQGLELDRAVLCWDADLIRDRGVWRARRFRACAWTRASAAAQANRINAYRVLLTRARHGTVIWVPIGDARDPTRDPSSYDAIATYLAECGAQTLDGAQLTREDGAEPEVALL